MDAACTRERIERILLQNREDGHKDAACTRERIERAYVYDSIIDLKMQLARVSGLKDLCNEFPYAGF